MIKKLWCILFHPIKVITYYHFMDIVSHEPVGKFYCPKCQITFLANKKTSWFRVEIDQ